MQLLAQQLKRANERKQQRGSNSRQGPMARQPNPNYGRSPTGRVNAEPNNNPYYQNQVNRQFEQPHYNQNTNYRPAVNNQYNRQMQPPNSMRDNNFMQNQSQMGQRRGRGRPPQYTRPQFNINNNQQAQGQPRFPSPERNQRFFNSQRVPNRNQNNSYNQPNQGYNNNNNNNYNYNYSQNPRNIGYNQMSDPNSRPPKYQQQKYQNERQQTSPSFQNDRQSSNPRVNYQRQSPPPYAYRGNYNNNPNFQTDNNTNNNTYRGRGRGRNPNIQPNTPDVNFDVASRRGRGGNSKGRGRPDQHNANQIVDNRKPMTDKQRQDRVNKFVNINTPQYQNSRGRGNNSERGQNRQRRARPKKEQQYQKLSNEQEFQKVEEEPSQEQYESIDEEDGSKESRSQQIQQSQRSYDEEQEISGEEEQIQQQNQNQNSLSEERDGEQVSQQPRANKYKKDRQNQSINQEQSSKMCSKKQFDNRMQIFIQNNHEKVEKSQKTSFRWKVIDFNLRLDNSKSFSIFELSRKTHLPDEQLALKKFQRSANRGQENEQQKESYVPRSKYGLINTMNHIKEYILNADDRKFAKQLPFPTNNKIQFIQIYVFLWDRMRQMIKDITRLDQETKNEQQIITICQEITRFFILSINEGRRKYDNQLGFDDKMNKESLVKVMTPLLSLYAISKLKLQKLIKQMQQNDSQLTVEKVMQRMDEQGIYISPNEPQITAYAIVFSQDFRKYLYQNIFIGLELKDANPLYESKQIQQALAIKSVLSLGNYKQYFQMIQSEDYDYLMSCLMLVNVDKIRRKISQISEKTFRYLEMNQLRKGVDQQQFMKLLYFKQNQKKQFKQFLRLVSAKIQNNGFVVWSNQREEDDGLYKSPHCQLKYKLARKLFQEQSKSKYEYMTRRQIVERSWKQSQYVQQLISCFIGNDFVPNKNIKKSPRKQPSRPQIKQKDKQRSEEADKPALNQEAILIQKQIKLEKQKKLDSTMKRFKFVKSFTSKLVQLMKPDQSKEEMRTKGVKNLMNCYYKIKQRQMLHAFKSIQLSLIDKIQKQIYLKKIHHFMSIKRQYANQFKINKNNNLQQKVSHQGMSKLLNKPQPQLEKVGQRLENRNIFIERLKNEGIRKFNIKIFTDSGLQSTILSLMNKFIGNFYNFLVNMSQSEGKKMQNKYFQKKIIQYVQQNLSILINLHMLDGSDEDWQHFFGADSVIYLQTNRTSKFFSAALNNFLTIRNSMKPSKSSNYPFALVKLGSSKNAQMASLQFQPIYQSFQLLSPLSISSCLPPSLALGLTQYLTTCISGYRNRPKLQIKSLGQLILQINGNSEYVCQQFAKIVDNETLFLYMQEYYNLCLIQIYNISKPYYEWCELFPNWLQIVAKIQQQNLKTQSPIKVRDIMLTQREQLTKIFEMLKLQSPFQAIMNKIILSKFDFDKWYSAFVSKFNPNQAEESKNAVIENMAQSLNIVEGKINGNIQQFYARLFGHLQQYLSKFSIIIPSEFRFYLSVVDIQQRVNVCLQKIANKIQKQQQKLAKSQFLQFPRTKLKSGIVPNKNGLESQIITKQKSPNEFKYERQQWLIEAKKKINAI